MSNLNLFNLNACMDSVNFYIKYFKKNPFEELGRSIIRAKQDKSFNKTMIEAWEKYIADNDIKWNEGE